MYTLIKKIYRTVLITKPKQIENCFRFSINLTFITPNSNRNYYTSSTMNVYNHFKKYFNLPCTEKNLLQHVKQLTLNESVSRCKKWATQFKLNKIKHLHSSNYFQPTLQTSNLINLYPTPYTLTYLSSHYATEIR